VPADHEFVTPSGNIVCDVYSQGEGVNCQVREHAWVQPASTTGPYGRPCNFNFGGLEFYLSKGNPGKLGCYEGSSNFTASNLKTLDYGQTYTRGVISCVSELSGVTCTDTATGHFIRVARESYDLG
jgi:hypothetical protein